MKYFNFGSNLKISTLIITQSPWPHPRGLIFRTNFQNFLHLIFLQLYFPLQPTATQRDHKIHFISQSPFPFPQFLCTYYASSPKSVINFHLLSKQLIDIHSPKNSMNLLDSKYFIYYFFTLVASFKVVIILLSVIFHIIIAP